MWILATGLIVLEAKTIIDNRATVQKLRSGQATVEDVADYLGGATPEEIQAVAGLPDAQGTMSTQGWQQWRRGFRARLIWSEGSAVTILLMVAGLLTPAPASYALIGAGAAYWMVVYGIAMRIALRSLPTHPTLDGTWAVPLLSTIEPAILRWKLPVVTEDSTEVPGATVYIFDLGMHRVALLTVWQGVTHAVRYDATQTSDPEGDLQWAMRAYGTRGGWHEVEAGYQYRSAENDRLLFCSAMPPISVMTTDFARARAPG